MTVRSGTLSARQPPCQARFADIHFYEGGPLTVQYLLVVDALNFCFWPEPGLEYEHLARGVKVTSQLDVVDKLAPLAPDCTTS